MSGQQQTTSTSNVNDDIKVPVINENENRATAAVVEVVSNALNWIQIYGKQISTNSDNEHYFRCQTCQELRYVNSPFRMFLNFPVCIDCAVKSFQEHR